MKTLRTPDERFADLPDAELIVRSIVSMPTAWP